MFAWIKSLIGANRKPAPPSVPKEQFDALNDRFREVKAKYDAAQTNDDNRRHWANADGLSAAAANTLAVRRDLRNRSRYEFDNGPYCSGIIRTLADDLVGTGPTLQILTDDDGLNEKIEQAFASWARACRFAEKLHTMAQAKARDGEAFAVMVTNKRINHPVKLDLDLVEADLVTDQTGTGLQQLMQPAINQNMLDGIEYDDLGNPVAYHILEQHPGDVFHGFPIKSRRVRAEFVLHWFRRDRPGQVRGVPELTSALPLFPYLRRWTLATLAAAETAANFAIVLENPNGVNDENPTVAAPFSTVELERNLATELPGGVTAKQIAAEHPGPQYEGFKREVLNECGRPVRMPSNVVSGDSSKHNFSSAKLDHYGYRGGIRVDRYFADIDHLDRIYEEFAREATLVGLFPASIDAVNLPKAFYWPGWPSMDKDDAKNDTERLNNGTETLSSILSEWNVDWKAAVRQRGRELAFMAENGVPPPPNGSNSAPGVGQPTGDPTAATFRGVHLNGSGGKH